METAEQAAVLCDLCDSDINVDFYCINCEQVLCLRCQQTHSRNTRTKHDEVIPLSEVSHQKKFKPLCNNHPKEEASQFCEQCDQFICGVCMVENHQDHKIRSVGKIKSKQDQLAEFIEDLKNKKEVFTKTLDIENSTHTQNTRCYDQIRTDISDQVNKIIEEVTSLREEKFTELSILQEQEYQRHADVLTSIQSNTRVLTMAIEMIQAGIDTGDSIAMETAESNARQSMKNVDIPPIPMKAVTEYKPGNINRPAVMPLFGDMLTEDQGARPKQQYLAKLGKPYPLDVMQHKIYVNKVKKMSTLQARNTILSIRVLVPVTQDTAWVAAVWDQHLTLINKDGSPVRTSVQLCGGDSDIIDAKQYNNDLLVTCWKQHQVARLTEDGGTKTTFCDMSPYYPWGSSVTHEMDVLLCLKSTLHSNDHDAKVIRLNSNGDRIQSIQRDDKGDLLYSWPYSVTSLQSGEVIVCDRDQHMRVSCINNKGRLMFTWNAEVQGRKTDELDPVCITHDKYNNLFITDYNNHRVFMLSRDGTDAKCLQGIQYPCGITVDDCRQLWVGCYRGKIHIIEY